MLIRIIAILLTSLPVAAQQTKEVKPVLTDVYSTLTRQQAAMQNGSMKDSGSNSLQQSLLTSSSNFNLYTGIEKIIISDNKLKILPSKNRLLLITGNYTGTVSKVSANRQPALQQQYVQGRSVNNRLEWQGAETNEHFSYGPAVSQLEYDGLPYQYDINGRLVNLGTGKQIPANTYNNNILQSATEWKQRLNVQAEIKENAVQRYFIKLTLGQNREQLLIPGSTNNSYTIAAKAGAFFFNKLRVAAGVELQDQVYTNGNRNGFLNRVYQQSLLTPLSFSNSQGYLLTNSQRSFNSGNDNPYFLLNKQNPYTYRQLQSYFSAEYKVKNLTVKSVYTPSHTEQQHTETYQPGTAFFPQGFSSNRLQKQHYNTWINTFSYLLRKHSEWRGELFGNITSTSAKVHTAYLQSSLYSLKRNTTDAGINLNLNWNGFEDFETGFSLGNNFYTSGTAAKNIYWLPTAGAYVRWNGFLNNGSIKLYVNTKQFASEPSLFQSYAATNLLQLNAFEAMRFFPLKEVSSFNGLAAERHRQYSAGMEFYFSSWLSFNANAYITYVKDAIFPLLSPTGIMLRNMAAYRNSGIEVQLTHHIRISNSYTNSFSNSISFFLSGNKVTGINDGSENIPVAGFRNVYKALIKGYAAGSIMGTDYRYDNNGKKIIGADGFPVVGNEMKVIGNPLPDFTIKLNQIFSYKRITVSADWEWRKDGDVWNGTRAVLDYYGRSAVSGEQRTIKQYVFDGVTENGIPNTIAVDFYNPSLPVEQNRWARYGYSGVAKDYIEKGSFIRLNNFSVGYTIPVKKWLRKLEVSAAASNILVWQAYHGVDPGQLLFDQAAAEGLDFFNLPSSKRFSLSVAVQF